MVDSFTDTAISGRSQNNGSIREGEKDLQPWEPGEDSEMELGGLSRGSRMNTSLEEGSRSRGWTAEEMFR